MENIKKIDIPKPNNKANNKDAEESLTSTIFKTIEAMDTAPRDIKSIAVAKLLVEMNGKLEKDRDTIKEENKKILKENSDLKVLEATVKEKIRFYKKNTFGEKFSNILIGISATTLISVDNEAFPKVVSLIILAIASLFSFYIFKKD